MRGTASATGRFSGSASCHDRTMDAGYRSRKTNRASGQQVAMRRQAKTLLGVFSTRTGLPLRVSSRCRRRSHTMCSMSLWVWPRCVIACRTGSVVRPTVVRRKCVSMGEWIREWLFSMTRSSVEPERTDDSRNTGRRSSRSKAGSTGGRTTSSGSRRASGAGLGSGGGRRCTRRVSVYPVSPSRVALALYLQLMGTHRRHLP